MSHKIGIITLFKGIFSSLLKKMQPNKIYKAKVKVVLSCLKISFAKIAFHSYKRPFVQVNKYRRKWGFICFIILLYKYDNWSN